MIYRHKYLINKLCLLGTVSVLSVSVGSVSTAIAQSAASEAADAGQIMDPVTITATRRASSVQEVAASVTALDNAELQALNAVSLVDAAGAVPGAEIFDDRGAGQPTWVIRGVGLTDFNVNNAPTAAIYYDETYLVSNVLGGIGLFDLERVEVLKGPQGGLYGRNTTGGVVRVISAKPDLGRASGALRASYGSSDEVRIQGAANLPIIKDKLAIRLAGQAVQGGGWQDSLATSGDDQHGDQDFLALRGQVRVAISQRTKMDLKLDIGQDQSETTLGRGLGVYDQFGDFCAPVIAGQQGGADCFGLHNLLEDARLPSDQEGDGRTVLSNPINALNNDWTGLGFQIESDLGFADFTSISSYLSFDYEQAYDYDGTPLALFQTHPNAPTGSEIEQVQQELRLVSKENQPLSWLVSAVWARDTIDQDNFANISDNVFAQAELAALFPDGTPTVLALATNYQQVTESWALYGEAGFDLSDTINLNASVRYTDEDKDFNGYTSFVDFGGLTVEVLDGVDLRTTLDDNVTGHVGLNWTPNETFLAYAKYSRGSKSGGFFGGIVVTEPELGPYGAETIDAIEIGFKSQPADDLILNGALYYYDYQDAIGYASVFNSVLQGPVTQLANIGDAEHIGAELEVFWRPEQFDGFQVQASASLLDAEITESPFTDLTQSGEPYSVEGLTRDFAPSFSFFALARQEFELGHDLTGSAQLSYSYRDDVLPRSSFGDEIDYGLGRYDGYGTLAARVSLGHL
jgi:iron complex outermembrane receptor protein